MNASAPALSREDDVQSKIRRVTVFGRFARVVCSALFAIGLVGSVGVVIVGVLGIFLPSPISADFTPQERLWTLPLFAGTAAVWLAVAYQLYRLFGNLALGVIYTSENVGRVRRVGLLWLLGSLLSVLVPYAWAGLVAAGLIEPSDPTRLERWLSLPTSLSSFVTAGIILLISWVMDVGLYEKDHAEALQRDADLVI